MLTEQRNFVEYSKDLLLVTAKMLGVVSDIFNCQGECQLAEGLVNFLPSNNLIIEKFNEWNSANIMSKGNITCISEVNDSFFSLFLSEQLFKLAQTKTKQIGIF